MMVEGQALERVQSQLQPAHPSPFAGVGTGHGLTAVRTRLGAGGVCTHTCQARAHLQPHTLCCMRVLSLRVDLVYKSLKALHSTPMASVECLRAVRGHHFQRHRAPCGPALSLLPLVKLQLSLALAAGGFLGLSPSREAWGPHPRSNSSSCPPLCIAGRHDLTVVLLIILRWFSFPPGVSCLPLLPSFFSKQISAKSQDPLRSASWHGFGPVGVRS